MTAFDSLILFKLILLTGFAGWMTVVFFNNVIAFAAGVFSVGMMMRMQLFDQEPAIKSPLLSRRVHGTGWHRLIYSFVVLVEGIAAVLFWYAALGFAMYLSGSPIDVASLGVRANLAFSALAALSFIMLIGGAWFVYYIRQEGTQITHFALIAVTIAGTVVMNLPAQ